jgi:hypothetical protein
MEVSQASTSLGSSETLDPEFSRLVAEYESALSTALAQADQIRAARAFDHADRLQHRLLRRAGEPARWESRAAAKR